MGCRPSSRWRPLLQRPCEPIACCRIGCRIQSPSVSSYCMLDLGFPLDLERHQLHCMTRSIQCYNNKHTCSEVGQIGHCSKPCLKTEIFLRIQGTQDFLYALYKYCIYSKKKPSGSVPSKVVPNYSKPVYHNRNRKCADILNYLNETSLPAACCGLLWSLTSLISATVNFLTTTREQIMVSADGCLRRT